MILRGTALGFSDVGVEDVIEVVGEKGEPKAGNA
jgi:hypothetical protein